MANSKMINNDHKNTPQKTNDRTTLKNGGELKCYGKAYMSCSTCGTRPQFFSCYKPGHKPWRRKGPKCE